MKVMTTGVKYSRMRGFTLMELMITIAIIAILVMVALPSYQDSVRKSKRSVAKNALMDVAARQEQYFTNNKTYTTLDNLGFPGATVYYDDDSNIVAAASGSLYEVTADPVTTSAYTLKATPQGSQTKDTRCKTFTLTSAGVKGITGGSGTASECW